MEKEEKRVMRVTNPKGSYSPVEGAEDNPNPPAPDNVARSRGFAQMTGVGSAVKRAWQAINKKGGR